MFEGIFWRLIKKDKINKIIKNYVNMKAKEYLREMDFSEYIDERVKEQINLAIYHAFHKVTEAINDYVRMVKVREPCEYIPELYYHGKGLFSFVFPKVNPYKFFKRFQAVFIENSAFIWDLKHLLLERLYKTNLTHEDIFVEPLMISKKSKIDGMEIGGNKEWYVKVEDPLVMFVVMGLYGKGHLRLQYDVSYVYNREHDVNSAVVLGNPVLIHHDEVKTNAKYLYGFLVHAKGRYVVI